MGAELGAQLVLEGPDRRHRARGLVAVGHDQRAGHAYAQLLAAWKTAFPGGDIKPAALLSMQGEWATEWLPYTEDVLDLVAIHWAQVGVKFDPKFVDPKHVFSDVENLKIVNNKAVEDPRKKKKNRQGYEDGVTMLFTEAKASEFITGDNSIKILNQCNTIKIDKPWIENHKKTTTEIKECLKDLKVLSLKDLRSLKKWKDALKADLDKIAGDENEENDAPVEKTAEEVELEELEEMDREIAELKEEERRKEKRKKKKKSEI